MPETRAERVVFALGLAVIGLLLAVVFLGRHSSEGAVSATPTTAPRTTVSVTSTSRQTTKSATSTASTTTTAATTTATPPATSGETRLELTARDDTWLSIRQGSSTGHVLFEGTLAKGHSRSYSATQFHVRFGAAANVTATLDGKPLPLPGGTYSVTIGRNGLGRRSA